MNLLSRRVQEIACLDLARDHRKDEADTVEVRFAQEGVELGRQTQLIDTLFVVQQDDGERIEARDFTQHVVVLFTGCPGTIHIH